MIRNSIIKEALRDQLKKTNISDADIQSISKLDLSRKMLTEVNDLSSFSNLESLDLTENCISDLSCISKLYKLKELRVGNDPFLSVEEKAHRKGKNHFEYYTFLDNLKELTHVEFTDTDIDNIEFVEKLSNVVEFWAYSNSITDINPLINCTRLYKAYFFDCPIEDINVCANIPSLCGLAVNETNVSDLSPLKMNIDFSYLDAHGANIKDIKALENMSKMKYLTLAGTYVSNIEPLLKMQEMEWLTLEVGNYLNFDKILDVLPELMGLNTVALNNCDINSTDKKKLQDKMPNIKIRFNEFGVW